MPGDSGCPEHGYVALIELTSFRGKLGLPVERDLHFDADNTISAYAAEARSVTHPPKLFLLPDEKNLKQPDILLLLPVEGSRGQSNNSTRSAYKARSLPLRHSFRSRWPASLLFRKRSKSPC
jgi:hypothetical protein